MKNNDNYLPTEARAINELSLMHSSLPLVLQPSNIVPVWSACLLDAIELIKAQRRQIHDLERQVARQSRTYPTNRR